MLRYETNTQLPERRIPSRFDLAGHFNDPCDPARSLQLNNRHWKNESFQNLDALREADDDVNHFRLGSLRKSLKRVKTLLPAKYHRSFVSRLVHSMLFRVWFEPVRFRIKLSDEFVRANSYDGPENEFYKPAQRTEELRYIADLASSVYQDKYGSDFMRREFSVRYANATNTRRVQEITRYGEFSDFHLDEYWGITSLVYLSQVGRENGCFSYLDGTNLVHKSHLLRALHQVVCFDMGCSTPEQTADLPLELRGGMTYGNYLEEEKVAVLRDSKVDFVGAVGDGLLFCGFDLFHRGGKPVAGERTSVFISVRGGLRVPAKRYASQLASSLWL